MWSALGRVAFQVLLPGAQTLPYNGPTRRRIAMARKSVTAKRAKKSAPVARRGGCAVSHSVRATYPNC